MSASASTVKSSVGALALSLFLRERPDSPFMAMTAYFDESGTHGSRIITVAGFIATVDQWTAYERDLGALFSEYGIKRYHAKDFRGNKGDFKKMLAKRKAAFNSRFLQLADSHLTCGLATVLDSASYERIYLSGEFPRSARPDTHYGLCVRAALWKSLSLIGERQVDWPLNVILEAGHKNAGDALKVFQEVRESLYPAYKPAFGSISFGSKDDLPLAVADSLAYAIFRMHSGFSQHPTERNAAVVGPADPPYYAGQKIPMSRTLIDETSLAIMRDDMCAKARLGSIWKSVFK